MRPAKIHNGEMNGCPEFTCCLLDSARQIMFTSSNRPNQSFIRTATSSDKTLNDGTRNPCVILVLTLATHMVVDSGNQGIYCQRSEHYYLRGVTCVLRHRAHVTPQPCALFPVQSDSREDLWEEHLIAQGLMR